jgi:hypothetical protein
MRERRSLALEIDGRNRAAGHAPARDCGSDVFELVHLS